MRNRDLANDQRNRMPAQRNVMLVRSWTRTALRLSLMASITTGSCLLGLAQEQPAAPKDAPAAPNNPKPPAKEQYKQKPVKLTDDKEIRDKAKEKDKAIKADGVDLTALEEFYRDYVIPKLTLSAVDQINDASKILSDDIMAVEMRYRNNKELLATYNTFFIKQMRELIAKDKDGKTYHPATRVEAAVLLGRLNSTINSSTPPVPDAKVQETLISLIDARDLDGLASSAIASLSRHVRFNATSEAQRKAIVAKVDAYLKSPRPTLRSNEAHEYLQEQTVDLLTFLARAEPGKEPESAKEANKLLKPMVLGAIKEPASEWLTEHALLSVGLVKPADTNAEEGKALATGTAKFIQASIKGWRAKVEKTESTVAMGGFPGGGPSGPGGRGGPGGGPGGGPPGSGGRGNDGDSPGQGGAPGGPGGSNPPKRENPFEKQPKEVKNARRMLHQRLERIHVGLNGAFKKETKESPNGIINLVADDDKEKIRTIIAKIEKLQTDLNDEKNTDIAKLKSSLRKSIGELLTASEAFTGETKEAKVEETEDVEEDAFGSN